MKKWTYLSFLLGIVLIALFVFLPKGQNTEINTIDTDELRKMLQDNQERVYLDVRTPEEFSQGHIDEFINFPLNEIPARYHELPKDKEIVLICRSGNRSMQAAKQLKDLGFNQLINISGGMNAWD